MAIEWNITNGKKVIGVDENDTVLFVTIDDHNSGDDEAHSGYRSYKGRWHLRDGATIASDEDIYAYVVVNLPN